VNYGSVLQTAERLKRCGEFSSAAVLRPVVTRITKDQKVWVEQRGFVVVTERGEIEMSNFPSGLLDNALGGSGVPLGGGAKMWVEIGSAFGHQTRWLLMDS